MNDEHSSTDPVPDSLDELSIRWRQETEKYVAAANDFLEREREFGWSEELSQKWPEETREPLVEAVLKAIRHANETGEIEGLSDRFPRAHSPFIEMLDANGQSLPVVFLLDDGRIVLQVGSSESWSAQFVLLDETNGSNLSEDLLAIGRSPNRKFFALATRNGVDVHRGWDGPVVTNLQWPDGTEGTPEGFVVKPLEAPPTPERLIPFDSGDKALLVSPDGVFVLTEHGAIRLLPTQEDLQEHFQWSLDQDPDSELGYYADMAHGAISPDGNWIAAGHQDSQHHIFSAKTFDQVGVIGTASEYPHHAVFSADSSLVAFNSCHFYSGTTVGIPTALLPNLSIERPDNDARVVKFDENARVYASVVRNEELIIGDASGYLSAFDLRGKSRWTHFIGSTIEDIDISSDGKRLVVTTYAGFVSILDLDTGVKDPFVIGNSTHKERRRWLFWKKEARPLIW